MSVNMIDHMVDTHHIDIDAQMLKRVKVTFFLKTVLLPSNGLYYLKLEIVTLFPVFTNPI